MSKPVGRLDLYIYTPSERGCTARFCRVAARASTTVNPVSPLVSTAMQSYQFTNDDIGKRVVDQQGTEIGLVSGVRHGTAYVDPSPDITTKLKTKLGWEDVEDDEYPLQDAAIEAVTDDEIRIE